MTCQVCGKGPQHGVTVYRMNAKGQPGVWACKTHRDATRVDPEVQKIVDIISDDDFIDLDTLIRNIAHDVCREHDR